MIFNQASASDFSQIMDLYTKVVEHVKTTDIKLGWNTQVYPDSVFVQTAIKNNQMYCVYEEGKVIAAAVVNHTVNDEYNTINWTIKEPSSQIATIHALAVSPDYRGKKVSSFFVNEITGMCRTNGDKAIHLDVIDTNIPAHKLYLRNGYTEIAEIQMYYEVVGLRSFWMMEINL